MKRTGTRVSDVTYDAATRCYAAEMTFFGPHGTWQIQVSAPGQPGWGYERTLDALLAAGLRARDAADPAPPAPHA